MAHKYLHVMYNAAGLSFLGEDAHHSAIASWQLEQAIIWNFDVTGYTKYRNRFKLYYNTQLSPSNFGVYALSFKPF
jgi:hypothetical protein